MLTRIQLKLANNLTSHNSLGPKCSYLTISKLITRHQMVLPTVKGDARSLRQTVGWQKERSSEVSEGRWETCPSIHTTSRGTAQTRDQGLVTRNA